MCNRQSCFIKSMMVQVLTTRWIVFLFAPVIFCNFSEADTNVLGTTIINENSQMITLNWIETKLFLANEHLPIWKTTDSPYFLQKDRLIMRELGPFKTYYDLDKSSAIILMEKWDCIYGIIDVRYTINCLPVSKLFGHQHKIGESQYVWLYNDVPDHDKPFDLSKTSTFVYNPNIQCKSDNQYKMLIKTYVHPNELYRLNAPICEIKKPHEMMNMPSTSFGHPQLNSYPPRDFNYKEEVITVYPEILIFISHEVARSTQLWSTLVLRYIVHLNAAAMLFAKLATHDINIRVNIAGIIIDVNGLEFPPALLFKGNPPEGEKVLDSVANFIKNAKDITDLRRLLFSVDSFDMFLYSTTHEWAERNVIPHVFSNKVFNIRQERISQKRRYKYGLMKYLGSIVDYTNIMQHYVNIARAIAHLMTVKNNPPNSNMCVDGAPCQSIMQIQGQNCRHCLTWSPENIDDFKNYLSTNNNRCYLRNLPRSLYLYDFPRKSLIPADQCLCFGFLPDMNSITYLDDSKPFKTGTCNSMLRCRSPINGLMERVTYPIDGTPCDKNDNNKVCWVFKCVTTYKVTDEDKEQI